MKITRGVLEVVAWFVIVTSVTPTTNGAGQALAKPAPPSAGICVELQVGSAPTLS